MERPLSRIRAIRASVPTQRATRTSLADVLLSICAFGLGCLIGRLRGGRWLGVSETRLHAKGALILGITTVLVLTLIGPAFPIGWLMVGYGGFAVFGLKNLQITGMIVLLIGLTMNLAPALANGAVPVSEVALESVGETNAAGFATVEGVRESSDTATSLAWLGDVVPVPLFNVVVSLGDLVMLVAIADIAANLMLRARVRRFDAGAVKFAADVDAETSSSPSRLPILSPLSRGFTTRPAHAMHRRPRLRPSNHSAHSPEHAVPDAQPSPTSAVEEYPTEAPDGIGSEAVIVLDDATAYIEQPPPPTSPYTDDVEISIINTPTTTRPKDLDLGNTDRRPIIDLTTSPSDDQLCEFLRRRAAADEQLTQLAPPSPGHRRNRGRLRRQRAAAETEFAEISN